MFFFYLNFNGNYETNMLYDHLQFDRGRKKNEFFPTKEGFSVKAMNDFQIFNKRSVPTTKHNKDSFDR